MEKQRKTRDFVGWGVAVKNESDLIEEKEVYIREHNAWVKIWDILSKVFNKSSEELNKPKYRVLAEAIERWAYYDRKRRELLKEQGNKYADDKGIFWKGNKI